MKIATQDDVKLPDPVPPAEFQYVPINTITVESQARSDIYTQGDDFKHFMESIRLEGVIEPIVLARQGLKLVLISGERRLRACQMLGLPTIPARILENVAAEKALRVQLMENMMRDSLNPIDEAAAYVRYFCLRRGDVPVTEIAKIFDNLDRDPLRVDLESSRTATAIAETTGRSFTSIRRYLSLLSLPREIQDALRYGKIPLSHAYLFAAELDNPGLMTIFKSLLEKPLTYEALKRRLNEARKQEADQAGTVKADTVSGYRRSFKNIRVSLQLQKGKLTDEQADTLLTDLRELQSLVEQCRAAKSA